MSTTRTIEVFAENCAQAGRVVPVGRYDEPSDDVVEIEVTEENLRFYATDPRNKNSTYFIRVAALLRRELGVDD